MRERDYVAPPVASLPEKLGRLELRRLFVGPPHPHLWTVWLMATPLLMGAALFFDVFPRESEEGVWLLGWPVVIGTHSQADGFAVAPRGWIVIAVQAGLYLLATAAVLWRQRRTALDPRVSGDA